MLGLVARARRSAGGPCAASVPGRVLTDYHSHLRPDDPEATPEPSTSPTRTSSATWRRRARPGSRSSASPSTSTASARRSRSGPPVLARAGAPTTSTPTASSCARRRCGSGSRRTSSPGREDRIAEPARRARVRLRRRLGALRSASGAVDHDGCDVWERDRGPRPGLGALLRDPRRGGAHGPLRHPRPPRPGQGLGRSARPRPERDPRFYYEPAVEAIAEAGIAVEVSTAGLAQAGRRALPGASVRGDVRRRRRRLRALLRRARRPSTSATTTSARSR